MGPQGIPGPSGPPGAKGEPGAVFADGIARPLYVWDDGTVRVRPEGPVVDPGTQEPEGILVPTGQGWTEGDAKAGLQRFLDTLPDGAKAVFPDGRRYQVSDTVKLRVGTRDIILDGKATLATTNPSTAILSSPFDVRSTTPRATNVTVRGLTFEGTGSSGGEKQTGIVTFGWDGLTVEGARFLHLRGDGICLRDSSYEQNDAGYPTTDVIVRDSHFDDISRCTIAGIWSQRVLIEDTFIGRACIGSPSSVLDIEPNLPRSVNGWWTMRRLTFGTADQVVTRHAFTLTRPSDIAGTFRYLGDLVMEDCEFAFAIPNNASYFDIGVYWGPIVKEGGRLILRRNRRTANARPYPFGHVKDWRDGGVITDHTGFRSTTGTPVTMGTGNGSFELARNG